MRKKEENRTSESNFFLTVLIQVLNDLYLNGRSNIIPGALLHVVNMWEDRTAGVVTESSDLITIMASKCLAED